MKTKINVSAKASMLENSSLLSIVGGWKAENVCGGEGCGSPQSHAHNYIATYVSHREMTVEQR